MDPNACLDYLLKLSRLTLDSAGHNEHLDHTYAIELAECVESLHDWVRGGGFLPIEWQNNSARVADALFQAMPRLP